jgi:hypothetical protein
MTPVLMTQMRLSKMQSIKHLFTTLFIHPPRDIPNVDFLRPISISFVTCSPVTKAAFPGRGGEISARNSMPRR